MWFLNRVWKGFVYVQYTNSVAILNENSFDRKYTILFVRIDTLYFTNIESYDKINSEIIIELLKRFLGLIPKFHIYN